MNLSDEDHHVAPSALSPAPIAFNASGVEIP